MSSSLQPHGLYSSWKSPGQNTGGGSLFLLQGIFPTQELSQCLLQYLVSYRHFKFEWTHQLLQTRWQRCFLEACFSWRAFSCSRLLRVGCLIDSPVNSLKQHAQMWHMLPLKPKEAQQPLFHLSPSSQETIFRKSSQSINI